MGAPVVSPQNQFLYIEKLAYFLPFCGLYEKVGWPACRNILSRNQDLGKSGQFTFSYKPQNDKFKRTQGVSRGWLTSYKKALKGIPS